MRQYSETDAAGAVSTEPGQAEGIPPPSTDLKWLARPTESIAPRAHQPYRATTNISKLRREAILERYISTW